MLWFVLDLAQPVKFPEPALPCFAVIVVVAVRLCLLVLLCPFALVILSAPLVLAQSPGPSPELKFFHISFFLPPPLSPPPSLPSSQLNYLSITENFQPHHTQHSYNTRPSTSLTIFNTPTCLSLPATSAKSCLPSSSLPWVSFWSVAVVPTSASTSA